MTEGGRREGQPPLTILRFLCLFCTCALLDLSIEGERAEQPGQAVAHTVSVRLGWQW